MGWPVPGRLHQTGAVGTVETGCAAPRGTRCAGGRRRPAWGRVAAAAAGAPRWPRACSVRRAADRRTRQ
eukprot:11190952-Lingulodinium_polyedra.AAC.1